MTEDILVIRDKRTDHRFFIDNIITDRYGPIIGPYGIAVYSVLVRHSNPYGLGAYPSHKTIAKKIGGSVATVKSTLAQLERIGLIESYPRYRADGGQTSNGYMIYDPPEEVDTSEHTWRGGYVYAVLDGDMCKIGCTKCLDGRMRALGYELGHDPILLAATTTEDRFALEARLHAKYAQFRDHGEWFVLSERQLTEVRGILTPGDTNEQGGGQEKAGGGGGQKATTNPPSSDQSTSSPAPTGAGEPSKKEPAFDRARISRALNATLTKPEDQQEMSPLAEYIKQEMGSSPSKGDCSALALPYTERRPEGDKHWPCANELWDRDPRFRQYASEQVAWWKNTDNARAVTSIHVRRKNAIKTITAFKHAKGYGFLDWLAKEEDAARATAPQTLPPAPEPYISDEQAAEDAAYIQDRINRKLI